MAHAATALDCAIAYKMAEDPSASPKMKRKGEEAILRNCQQPFSNAPNYPPQTPIQKRCSDEATALGLHGAERFNYREGCMNQGS